MNAEVALTTKRPEPPKADFAFEIDFVRGEGSPSRVFIALQEFIRASESLDSELITSIDSNVETVMVLEDIEAGSIKVWLRNLLRATEDDALKGLDWKPAVGKYLVRAKYAVLRWIDDDKLPKDLPSLRREIQDLARETDVRHLPDYTPPSPKVLLEAVRNYQQAKEHLHKSDVAKFISRESELEMNLTVRFEVADIEALAVKETITSPPTQLILAVKKPDYLGDSKWELRHGRRTVSAKLEDSEWLKLFQGREVDVRPGDALKCEVVIENLYGHDNELIAERYTVTRVLDVLVDRYRQSALFGPDDNPSR